MARLPNLEETVLRMVTKLIDIGSFFRCTPYKRVNPTDYRSFDLQLSDRGLFLLVITLLCVHSVAQWISFFCYVPYHGLNIQASLHLNFLALYTCLCIFSLQQILNPEALLDVQNQIHRLHTSFRKSWTKHPVLIFSLASMYEFLFLGALFTLGLYWVDPTSPMFVATSLLNMIGGRGMTLIGGYGYYGIIRWIILAVLETFLVLGSLLATFSVGQTCIISLIAMNMWMEDLRNRMKEAEILIYSHWIVFEKLYRRIEIFSVFCNTFWSSIIMPGFAVLTVVPSAGSLFCTLRLHGHIHPVVYAFFPILTVYMIGVSLFGVFGQLSKVNRNSRDCMNGIVNEGRKLSFLWSWNAGDDDFKCLGRELRALRSFGAQIATFGSITASTQLAMFDQIINYVILLLSL